MAPSWRGLKRSCPAATENTSSASGVNAELMTAPRPAVMYFNPYSWITWLSVISTTETSSSRGTSLGGGITRCPRDARYSRIIEPAMVQRRPAKIPGETVEIPTFIASQVVPQTKQMKTNIARCDAVAEVFIGVADVLLSNPNATAFAGTAAAPKWNGAYA